MTQVQLEPTQAVSLVLNAKWCKGCSLCVESCPKKVLSLNSLGKVEVCQEHKCIGCGMCETMCPDYVIRVIKSA